MNPTGKHSHSESGRSAAEEKSRLRTECQAYRSSLGEEEYERLSHLILDQVVRLREIREAKTVHVYWPIVERREIDTRPLIRWLRDRRTEVILPVVETFEKTSAGGPRLRHARFPGEEDLRLNRWGIHEPAPSDEIPLEAIDVVIVPALGADRNGYRIGHGYGYYDEFLTHLAAARIGLVYSSCLLEDLLPEKHDVPMNVVVTENEVIRSGTVT